MFLHVFVCSQGGSAMPPLGPEPLLEGQERQEVASLPTGTRKVGGTHPPGMSSCYH